MNEEEFGNLNTGDMVRRKSDHANEIWLVTGNYGGRITAVRTMDLTNPSEWDLMMKAQYQNDHSKRFVIENMRTSEWYRCALVGSRGRRVDASYSNEESAQAVADLLNEKDPETWIVKKLETPKP